jgi:hypothetical protein
MICPALIIVSRILEWPSVEARIGPAHAALGSAVAWAQLAVALWLAYALAGRAGQEGPNAYGADPRGG